MKYFEVHEFGPPEVLRYIDAPGVFPAPGENEVQIKVMAAGVNYADLMARTGDYPPVSTTPYRPGFEVAGVVTQVGSGVTAVEEGDHVSSLVRAGGGYSTHAVVPANGLFKLPDDLDFTTAVALLIQGLTAYFLNEEAGVEPGHTVLVADAGCGMGSLAVQVAVLKGATVIGLASEAKHSFVKKLGAAAAISYRTPGWSKQVLQLTQGRGVDVFLDSQGNLSDLDVFKAIARGGKWLMHGWQEANPSGFPADRIKALIYKNLTIRGYSADWNTAQYPKAMETLMGWVANEGLKINVIKYPLSQAVKAHQDIASRATTGKVVLIP